MLSFKSIFSKQTIQDIAKIELEEAQKQLLVYQSATELASNLARYNQERIKRLTLFISGAN